MHRILVAAAAAACFATPAVAAEKDPLAHAAIQRGDFDAAERRLRAEQRIFPDRPEVLLNLATVLARTGRADSARALYERVLGNDDVSLRLADDRNASAHALARVGLDQIRQPRATQITAR